MNPLIQVKNLYKTFSLRKRSITAVSDLSFSIYPSETLGLVGESGCGKSTVGHCLLRLNPPSSGEIFYEGKNVNHLSKKELFAFRRQAQMIFQDPYSSLNPRMTIADIIAEPLRVHKTIRQTDLISYLTHLLNLVGLSHTALKKFPHEFSGGQRQRIGIARALALKPKFIVCDEPISALDVSIQAQIVNLLKQLQKELGLTYLFIAHDLSMVKYISDRVAVMYLGHLVEIAPAESLYNHPQHPYTQALLSAIPIPDPTKEKTRDPSIPYGELPSENLSHPGCPFANRCPHASPKCTTIPEWREVLPHHFVRCHHFP